MDRAKIIMDDFREKFFISLEYWQEADYITQWKEGLQKITVEKAKQSLLVADIGKPKRDRYIATWAMYREGSVVFVQNTHLRINQKSRKLLKKREYKFIYDLLQPRQTLTQSGNPISEWQISVSSLEAFLREDLFYTKF
jgi:hypothetical protein